MTAVIDRPTVTTSEYTLTVYQVRVDDDGHLVISPRVPSEVPS